MLKKRIIPAIDVLNDSAVKYVKFRNPTIVGDPAELGQQYAEAGADEIIYLDTTASLTNDNVKYEWIRRAAENVFVPFSVIGGVRTVEDFKKVLRCGADKVGINSAAVKRPELITEAAEIFGKQCVVLGLDAKAVYNENKELVRYEVYTHSAHQSTGLDVVEWAQMAEQLGVGEIICTSIDKDGTKDGYDIGLLSLLSQSVNVPIIASGGAGKLSDIGEVFEKANVDAALVASLLHYKECTIDDIKQYLKEQGIHVRY
ncbi:imidazole glycerol phosphate synthase subunit HisF [Paenibacillus hemerocallicola]|uniref:Imidazole glycerol phosphate synthase subunit HisF n=1 Tax=Paenibacillus hemerocallicola TaxID=1172614 RepID=A0A5C4T7S0_9BACL|nr:imidazole glycerol phosphate synthase subunit HisF [Paenibacillus hemerocallicola]TNJ64359.1 imidazole glycerol phosphate synthase subunit HisF [Paenibacillus hemerocallicola]